MKRPASALWLVNKPAGVTSHALVDEFRAAHAGNFTLKVSHGGVLDPFAHGLMVLLVGSANRLFPALHEVPKRYVARIAWGTETDTGDAGGATVRTSDASGLTAERLDAALVPFRGWTQQVPPATSNKRVNGERAYALAHRGEAVPLAPQPVYLQDAQWLSHDLPSTSTLALSVRGGFYVRSLAVDLGRALNVGAHVNQLERTDIGPWSTPEQPKQITGTEVLPWLPHVILSDSLWGKLRSGTVPSLPGPAAPAWPLPEGFPAPSMGTRAFHQGRLVALLKDGAPPLMLPGGI